MRAFIFFLKKTEGVHHSSFIVHHYKTMNYLAIGHICHDWTSTGYLLGGTASYVSLFAHKLENRVGIVTSYGNNFQFADTFKNIPIHNIPSKQTTVFKNTYLPTGRTQYLLNRATPITATDIPKEWLSVKMVHIGPIANEVDFSVIDLFEDSIVCICPQGWMRRWDDDGKVFYKMIKNWERLKKADLLILSREDLDNQLDLIPDLADMFKVLVVTNDANGADVFFHGKKIHFPSYPVTVLDSTGAGDIFAAGFLIKYAETLDIVQSAGYGHCAASFCIEGIGTSNLPTRKELDNRLEIYQSKNSTS